MLYLNLLVLMTVVFIPFSTALMADHLKSGADEEVAAFVYTAAFFAMGAASGFSGPTSPATANGSASSSATRRSGASHSAS